MRTSALVVAAWLAASPALADDPPEIEHQPSPCSTADKAISLCAGVSDDNMVAKARVYFRGAGEKFYNFVDMTFGGINYCATLPAPRAGKVTTLEYYVQAVDDQYQSQRTSTYQMQIQPEGSCEFPPLERDAAKCANITVYATSAKQGKKLPDEFQPAGVKFVPIASK